MYRWSFAVFLLALAIAHAVDGALIADAENATLAIVGASATTRWIATQLLGASIAGYAVAGMATLRIAAPGSWRASAVVIGAASSLLLTGVLWRTATWSPFLAIADVIAVVAIARRPIWADSPAEPARTRSYAS
jgi:hypothetical protein